MPLSLPFLLYFLSLPSPLGQQGCLPGPLLHPLLNLGNPPTSQVPSVSTLSCPRPRTEGPALNHPGRAVMQCDRLCQDQLCTGKGTVQAAAASADHPLHPSPL